MKTLIELRESMGELQTEIDGIMAKESPTDEDKTLLESKLDEQDKVAAEITLRERSEKNKEYVDKIPKEERAKEKIVLSDVKDLAAEKPWRSFGEYIQAVILADTPVREKQFGGMKSGHIDKRLYKGSEERATGMSESVPSTGGFLVQTDYSNQLIDKIHQTGILLPRTDKGTISSNSNGITIPGVDESSRVDGSRTGGILAYWKDEAAAKAASKPKFREINLKLNKLTGLVYLTDELMADVSFLENWVSTKFNEEFRFKIDDAIYRGTGAGQPLGILNSGAIVTVAKETGQPANTIWYQNIVNMYARMFGITSNRSGLVWVANQDVIPQLMSMNMAVGTGGVPVWLPANGIAGQPNDTLMGIPILYIEHASTLGTTGDIGLFNLNEYQFVDKGGIDAASSIHLRFNYDETVLRFVWRVDGQPKWNKPLTPFKGTATQSPFVLLATRS